MVDITNATTGVTSSVETMSAAATQKLNTDYQSFLKLLTAQLTNQDPLEPMDRSF